MFLACTNHMYAKNTMLFKSAKLARVAKERAEVFSFYTFDVVKKKVNNVSCLLECGTIWISSFTPDSFSTDTAALHGYPIIVPLQSYSGTNLVPLKSPLMHTNQPTIAPLAPSSIPLILPSLPVTLGLSLSHTL